MNNNITDDGLKYISDIHTLELINRLHSSLAVHLVHVIQKLQTTDYNIFQIYLNYNYIGMN